MTPLLRLSALVLLACTCLGAHAQTSYIPIEQRLTEGQLRATGLDTLSAEQLRLLNALLSEDQAARTQAIREQLEQESERDRGGSALFARDRSPIVSKIVGEFRGWTSGARFVLENGQTWRVVGTPEYYLPRSRAVMGPAVAITPGLVGGWYMSVEGQSPRAKVQRAD
jgi:hypothetical protein